jgi:hypothetical protein
VSASGAGIAALVRASASHPEGVGPGERFGDLLGDIWPEDERAEVHGRAFWTRSLRRLSSERAGQGPLVVTRDGQPAVVLVEARAFEERRLVLSGAHHPWGKGPRRGAHSHAAGFPS